MSRKVLQADRSVMFVPINNQRFVDALGKRNCDAVIFDLEDGVGEPDKVASRELTREAYRKARQAGIRIRARVNHDYWYADLDAIVWPGLTAACLPKVESAEEVSRLAARIAELERERGVRAGSVEIHVYIETMRGIANVRAIAAASPRVTAVIGAGSFGFDHCRDLAMELLPGVRRTITEYSGGEALLACAAADVPLPLSIHAGPGPAGDVVGAESASRDAVINREAGYFQAMSVLHPNRVEPMNQGLTPSEREVAEARVLLAKFIELSARGEVEGELDGKLVDRYAAGRARALVEWSEACARRDAEKAAVRDRARSQGKN